MNIDNLRFLSGAEMSNKSNFIVCQDSNLDISKYQHSLFRMRTADGEWLKKGNSPWVSTGISTSSNGNGIVSLGPDGEFLELQFDGSHTRDNVLKNYKNINLTFRFIKLIDGILYAGGTDNYIFSFINNKWTEIDTDAMRDVSVPKSFENVTGFHAKELYAFGWEGAIWSNSTGKWKKISSSTEYILNDGDVHNQHVYIAGQLGTILKGRNDQWEIIDNRGLDLDIWSVQSFRDSVYFSTARGILKLENNKLTMFKSLGSDMRTTMNLFVGPSGLWSVGTTDITLFDGEQWHTIEQN